MITIFLRFAFHFFLAFLPFMLAGSWKGEYWAHFLVLNGFIQGSIFGYCMFKKAMVRMMRNFVDEAVRVHHEHHEDIEVDTKSDAATQTEVVQSIQAPADLFRSCREKLGMTQQDLAEKIGVSASTISRIENEFDMVELGVIHRAANVLGITMTLPRFGFQNEDGSVKE